MSAGMDPYATHLAALVDAALATSGPLLELGCGHYSTPVLAAIARHRGRKLRCLSSNRGWAATISRTYGVDVELVDWQQWAPGSEPLGLVLLDNEQSVNERIKHLPALADVADVVVVHDADVAIAKPHWLEMSKGFAHCAMHKELKPWTAVLYRSEP